MPDRSLNPVQKMENFGDGASHYSFMIVQTSKMLTLLLAQKWYNNSKKPHTEW